MYIIILVWFMDLCPCIYPMFQGTIWASIHFIAAGRKWVVSNYVVRMRLVKVISKKHVFIFPYKSFKHKQNLNICLNIVCCWFLQPLLRMSWWTRRTRLKNTKTQGSRSGTWSGKGSKPMTWALQQS